MVTSADTKKTRYWYRMVLPPDINVGGMFYYRMIILMEILTHRHLEGEETSDTSTNVSIIDPRVK